MDAGMTVVNTKYQAPALDKMLDGIDVVNNKFREKHIEGLRNLARWRGVRVVADHRISDGDFAVLVSPGDFARMKEKKVESNQGDEATDGQHQS